MKLEAFCREWNQQIADVRRLQRMCSKLAAFYFSRGKPDVANRFLDTATNCRKSLEEFYL